MTLYNLLTTSELVDISRRTPIRDYPISVLSVNDLSQLYLYLASVHTVEEGETTDDLAMAVCTINELRERIANYAKRAIP